MPLLSTFGAASTRSFGGIGAAAAGAGLDIDEVFSTFLYDGNSSSASSGATQTINNGIDLSGEGGLVWIKRRDGNLNHAMFDTARGAGAYIATNLTAGHYTGGDDFTSFNSNGFTLGDGQFTSINYSSYEYVSWTWRKAPKFFDVISIDVADPEPTSVTVNHNLGQEVGMVIMKPYLHTYPWYVWHRSIGANYSLELNSTAPKSYVGGSGFSSTSTTITIPGSFVHSGSNNGKCILYLFAHNNNDGEFGPDKDKDVIKCGSYTGNYTAFKDINLGFEPQWVLIKNTSTNNRDWLVFDNMRGAVTGGNDAWLRVDNNQQEYSNELIQFYANGFSVADDTNVNQSGNSHIYVAIRRGPLAIPEDATKVFAIDSQGSTGDGNAPSFRSNFPVDMAIRLDTSGASKDISARLTGATRLYTDLTNAESSFNNSKWDYQNGWYSATSTITNYYAHMWKRAPGYFDVVTYQSTTSAQTLNHNLSAIPEMMWIKNRDDTKDWQVYHSALGNTKYLQLNTTDAEATASNRWNDTSPTATQFTVGTAQKVNDVTTTRNYIAHLFATVANVSKVGSITGNGSTSGDSQTIDCGFSSGARFVLIKRTSGPGGWYVFDSVRGIVSGNDPFLALNNTNAETTNVDLIDPTSSGFIFNYDNGWMTNISGETYIFYAIA